MFSERDLQDILECVVKRKQQLDMSRLSAEGKAACARLGQLEQKVRMALGRAR